MAIYDNIGGRLAPTMKHAHKNIGQYSANGITMIDITVSAKTSEVYIVYSVGKHNTNGSGDLAFSGTAYKSVGIVANTTTTKNSNLHTRIYKVITKKKEGTIVAKISGNPDGFNFSASAIWAE